jgi:hypothetical protein
MEWHSSEELDPLADIEAIVKMFKEQTGRDPNWILACQIQVFETLVEIEEFVEEHGFFLKRIPGIDGAFAISQEQQIVAVWPPRLREIKKGTTQ